MADKGQLLGELRQQERFARLEQKEPGLTVGAALVKSLVEGSETQFKVCDMAVLLSMLLVLVFVVLSMLVVGVVQGQQGNGLIGKASWEGMYICNPSQVRTCTRAWGAFGITVMVCLLS